MFQQQGLPSLYLHVILPRQMQTESEAKISKQIVVSHALIPLRERNMVQALLAACDIRNGCSSNRVSFASSFSSYYHKSESTTI